MQKRNIMINRHKLPSDLPFIKGVSELPQIAIITRDTEKMANQLAESLNLGSFKVFSAKSPQLFNSLYDNKPENWAMKAGLTWLGNTQIEIIQPTAGQTVYDDYLNNRNQKAGIEHIFFTTDNFETTLDEFKKVGYPLKQEAQLNASGKLGIFPVPALPSFLKHLAARFGYTSTIEDLKIDIELAKFPKGVSQRMALKAAIPEKWIPEKKPHFFEESPADVPFSDLDTFFILCKNIELTVANYAKLTDNPPKIETYNNVILSGTGKLSRIVVGTSLMVIVQPTDGKMMELLESYGEGLTLLGFVPKASLDATKNMLKSLGWEYTEHNNHIIATHNHIPFAILVRSTSENNFV